jgi:hypothetical protein
MNYLKDPKTNEPSPTLTLMWVGVIVALIKLLLADTTFAGIQFGSFSGSDFALVISPFVALYGHKRQVNAASENKKQKGE